MCLEKSNKANKDASVILKKYLMYRSKFSFSHHFYSLSFYTSQILLHPCSFDVPFSNNQPLPGGVVCMCSCVLWDWGCGNMGKYALSLGMCSWDTRCPRLILTHGLWADTSFSFSINCLHVADNISKASCFDL